MSSSTEFVLRDTSRRMGAQRSADQGASHDLHPGELLQLHGGHGHLLAAGVRRASTGRSVPRHVH